VAARRASTVDVVFGEKLIHYLNYTTNICIINRINKNGWASKYLWASTVPKIIVVTVLAHVK
jgi:hypothetical protein